jgi:hypothetical protein
MKRSSCLSAFLVALTATSIASAAPESPQDKKPTFVAQAKGIGNDVAQTDGSGTGAGTGSSPTTAPSDASPPSESPAPQPAVTIGTPTGPTTDTPQAAAEEGKVKPKTRPFAGTQLYATTSMTTNTVFRGQTQYDDPTVESNLWILPRYNINEAFQLRGRLIVSYELTNSDTTLYRNEPQLSDVGLQLFYKKIPEIATIKPSASLNVGLPTSKVSRARTLIFSPGASFQLSKAFEKVGSGEIDLLGAVTYSHPIYQSRQAEVVDPRAPGAFQCAGGNGCQDLLSGTLNPSDSLSYSFLASGQWGKWSPAIYYLGASQWAYTPKEVNESDVVAGAPSTPVQHVASPTHVRQTHYFSVWLDYDFNSWLTGEVGYWNAISALDEDSTRANLFFSRYQDTRVYLGLNFNIDNLMKQLEGGETEAGIVRAQNTHKPMFAF